MGLNKIVISIDLATRQSGIVVRINGKAKIKNLIEIDKWKDTTDFYNDLTLKIKNIIYEIKKSIYTILEFDNNIGTTDLVIELSNFSNPLNTQRMAFIAGLICQSTKHFFGSQWVNIYMFNANKWFEKFNEEFCKIKDWTHIKREERKELSIKHFLEQEDIKELNIDWNFYDKSQLSDIADAYWIGKYHKQELGYAFVKPIGVICGNKKKEVK